MQPQLLDKRSESFMSSSKLSCDQSKISFMSEADASKHCCADTATGWASAKQQLEAARFSTTERGCRLESATLRSFRACRRSVCAASRACRRLVCAASRSCRRSVGARSFPSQSATPPPPLGGVFVAFAKRRFSMQIICATDLDVHPGKRIALFGQNRRN